MTWLSYFVKEYERKYKYEVEDMENMSVFEALQLIIRKIEDTANGCVKLDENVRRAKVIIYKYVTEKLAEEVDREESKED